MTSRYAMKLNTILTVTLLHFLNLLHNFLNRRLHDTNVNKKEKQGEKLTYHELSHVFGVNGRLFVLSDVTTTKC